MNPSGKVWACTVLRSTVAATVATTAKRVSEGDDDDDDANVNFMMIRYYCSSWFLNNVVVMGMGMVDSVSFFPLSLSSCHSSSNYIIDG
jgi:hypothetical protein